MDARVCFAPRTRALFRFQHGCPGQGMHLEHGRYLGLAMDALIRVCTKNKSNILEWGMEVHEFPNGGTFSGLLRATWREQRKTPHCKSFNGAVVPHFAYIKPLPHALPSLFALGHDHQWRPALHLWCSSDRASCARHGRTFVQFQTVLGIHSAYFRRFSQRRIVKKS